MNLKGLDYQTVTINLLDGQESADQYLSVNPQGLVPALEHDGCIHTQSMAILEYLEEAFPEPRLLPEERQDRSKVRALSNIIACEIHPLNNLRVLKYLVSELNADEDKKMQWYRHWIEISFKVLEEKLLEYSNGLFCFGDRASLADVMLIPQVYNARRFNVSLEEYPTIAAIDSHCLSLEAFKLASPENQPDAG